MNATIPDDDDGRIVAEWNAVVAQVYAATERAKSDVEFFESLDLEFQMVTSDNANARLLRAVARKLVPQKFNYAITPAIGGVHLTFQGLNSGGENEHDPETQRPRE